MRRSRRVWVAITMRVGAMWRRDWIDVACLCAQLCCRGDWR